MVVQKDQMEPEVAEAVVVPVDTALIILVLLQVAYQCLLKLIL